MGVEPLDRHGEADADLVTGPPFAIDCGIALGDVSGTTAPLTQSFASRHQPGMRSRSAKRFGAAGESASLMSPSQG